MKEKSNKINITKKSIENKAEHRKRMRLRFAKTGFQGFHDYEILEFLLFFIFRQGDTKQKAKALLDKFGSFAYVLDASVEEISEIEGMGLDSAMALKAMRNALAFYFDSKAHASGLKLSSIMSVVDYIRAMIGGKHNESLFVIFMSSNNNLLHSEIIAEGTVTQAPAFPRRIVEEALRRKAASVILAHNHPNGDAEPSETDISITREIKASLALVDIILIEHIILSDTKFYSFNRAGYLP